MPAHIIDGRKIAGDIKAAVKRDLKNMRLGRALVLTALQIGGNSSTDIYLQALRKLAKELGIAFQVRKLGANVSQKTAEHEILRLNQDKKISGIIVQTPVPRHINIVKLLAEIAPDKDVEGLNPANIGKLVYKKNSLAPCTASACMALIKSTGVELRGKEAVIIGHSAIVGKPLSLMLLAQTATTSVCHIGTYERGLLKEHVARAEVLVVSVGKCRLIKGDWIRKGALVIDVGINQYKGTVCGDVDFDSAKKKARYITPVPGGVGPLTTVMLIKNLVFLCKRRRGAHR